MKDCLFCKIVSGEIGSLTLFEDDIVKVMLDAYPDSPGHTLIIPKKHFLDLDDIDMDTLTHIMKTAKSVKKLLESKLNPDSIVLMQNNGEAEKIKHFHLHLIPKYEVNLSLDKESVYKKLMEE